MSTTRVKARTQWSVIDPSTHRCRLVDASEFFPIAGRLLSGVWQLDDGRVLIAMSADDPVPEQQIEQPTVRVEYLDLREGAVRGAPHLHSSAGLK